MKSSTRPAPLGSFTAIAALVIGLPLAAPAFAQQGATGQDPPLVESVDDAVPGEVGESATLRAETLRARIRDMRMNLLLGGDRVRAAESEAIDFYGGRAELIDQGLDSAHAELTEKRAEYNIAIDRTLGGETTQDRLNAMEDAAALKRDMDALEFEVTDFEKKRDGLAQLITTVQERERERSRIMTRLETSTTIDGLGLPLAAVGLAPLVEASDPVSPLDDQGLIADLLERDPRAARRILFESDPEGYWGRFPLRPPTSVVREALPFPLPDLPGQR